AIADYRTLPGVEEAWRLQEEGLLSHGGATRPGDAAFAPARAHAHHRGSAFIPEFHFRPGSVVRRNPPGPEPGNASLASQLLDLRRALRSHFESAHRLSDPGRRRLHRHRSHVHGIRCDGHRVFGLRRGKEPGEIWRALSNAFYPDADKFSRPDLATPPDDHLWR